MTPLRRRCLLAPAGTLVLALVVAYVGVPYRSTVDTSIATEAACSAVGGAWTFPGIPGDPSAPPYCQRPAADAGARCISSRWCQSTACRPDPAASPTQGLQLGRCERFRTLRPDCGEVVRFGLRVVQDCKLD